MSRPAFVPLFARTTFLALAFAGAAAPALASEYLLVTTSRQKIVPVSSRECPVFDLKMAEFDSEAAAKEARKAYFDQKDDRTDKSAHLLDRKRVSIVYKYLSTAEDRKHCEFIRYDVARGKTAVDAEQAMLREARGKKLGDRAAPTPVRVWPR